jgi:isopentenyl-diphosphate delta-isomerase
MTATKDVSPTALQGKAEYVILVDEQNQEIGLAEKMQAHEKNLLHRAFSVFICREKADTSTNSHAHTSANSNADTQANSNSDTIANANTIEILLQQRALHKYHSPGLWTNTCCSHPRPGEAVLAAGKRRLVEEMGITAELKDLGWFKYNAHFSNGLSEHEIDHVLIGWVDTDSDAGIDANIEANPDRKVELGINADEVAACRWITIADLKEEMQREPQRFTPWLAQALEVAASHIK